MAHTYRSQALSMDVLRSEVDLLDPGVAVAVAVLDLDGFAVACAGQDAAAGDALLGRCEQLLRKALPDGGLLAHVRGDEFAVALPDAAPEALLISLESARQSVADATPVTLSGGVAGRPHHGTSTDELFSAADTALVRAKRDGADRISMAVQERMVLKTSYFAPAALHRLAKLARRTGRPEASLLREALDELLAKHRDHL